MHEVAERLGHDPATLMRYYARVNAARRLQATDRIAELMTLPEGDAGLLRNRPDDDTSPADSSRGSQNLRSYAYAKT